MSRLIHGWPALLRRLARRPGFALAVLLTLVLGVGANTVTFDLIYGYLLSPLPYPRSEELASVYFTSAKLPGNLGMSYTTYLDLMRQTTQVADAGMIEAGSMNLVAGSQVAHVASAEITASLLRTLGVPPALGRLFGPAANEPGGARQVLLSHRLWSRMFGGDPAVLGRTIQLNGTAYDVVGVMPERFQLPDPDTDVWMAKVVGPDERDPGNITAWGATLIVRLRPGVGLEQLAAEAQAVLDREVEHFPDATAIPEFHKLRMRMAATPLRNLLLGDLRQHLLLAQLATGLLLLLIWVNLANLFIARALRQRGELVLRRVLGAETPVLLRGLLAESLTLCLAGGAAGFLLGQLAVRALSQMGLVSAALPPVHDVSLVAGSALLLAVLSALVFALAGLYFIRRQDLAQALKEMDARSAGGRGERRVRTALVVTQLTIACVLTAIGSMLAHSLLRLGMLETGFTPRSLVTFQINTPLGEDPRASGPPLQRSLAQLRRTLAAVPGATAVTIASDLPFDAQIGGNAVFQYPYDGRHDSQVFTVETDADYFRTLGVQLVHGAALAGVPSEGEGGAVLDVRAAQGLFGGTDVVGREFNFNSRNDGRRNMRFRVRGVVGGTLRDYEAGPRLGTVYLDRDQVLTATGPGTGWSWVNDHWYVAVRTPLPTAAILPSLQQAVQRVLPGVPVYDVRTMNERMSQQLASRRTLATLVLIFAFSALAVAAVGLYAVASYGVGQRRPELGVRAALGADPARLRSLVLGEVGRQLLVGAPLGLAGAVALGRAFSDSLQAVQSADLLSLVLVTLILTLVTLIAGWVPAWRAGRISPVEALRDR